MIDGNDREYVVEVARGLGFRVETVEDLTEIEGTAFVMRHEMSGARLLYLRNEDANKAFSISFKTPASDDTGVFHILEHSVLCGSRKFPVKEPFVDLLKTSMQTFLNAMTFPDKTMYPVASTNEQDLENLADVYLDAVFHPAIFEKRAIFEQEGWHLEVREAEEGEGGCAPQLEYNGVVFNEMKGALSDPDDVLYNAVSAALFPDTAYRFESGGVPSSIPDLTYEDFLDAHRRHYRPDNSYIVLYGDLDIARFLTFIARNYLEPVTRELERTCVGEANALRPQAPVTSLGVTCEMPTAPENACCAMGFVVGSAADRERLVAVDILVDAILGSNEAPMRRALLDADFSADAGAFLADAVLQPFVFIGAKGLKAGRAARLREVVREQARILSEGGLDRTLVDSALSHAEFVMRERSFGVPDGVALAMSSLSGWLYDDSAALSYIKYEDVFARLREKLDQGYFERLLAELFLENAHVAEVELIPVETCGASALDLRLDELSREATEEDLARIEADVAALRAHQETPDAPEATASLPRLRVSDIGDAPFEEAPGLEEVPLWGGSAPCLRHRLSTHGIVYAYRYFDLSCLAFEELPYARILSLVLGKLPTSHHSAAQIDTLIQSRLGNLSFRTEVHEREDDREHPAAKLVVSASALSDKAAFAAELADEVMFETDFSDLGKIKNILMQKRIAIEQGMASSGHSVAMARAASYYLPAAVLREQLGGVDFYLFLRDLTDSFDDRAGDLELKLCDVASRVFSRGGCLLSFAGEDGDLDRYLAGCANAVSPEDESPCLLAIPDPVNRREALVVPADVSFSAMGYDRRLAKVAHSGALLLLSRILSYDYLWNEVRVKGGAYGAGFQVTRAGSSRFYSYRDPRIDETLSRMSGAADWIESFDPSASEMEGFAVSTVAGIDAPCKPRELVRRQAGMYFAGVTLEQRREVRRQVMDATVADVRATASLLRQIARAGCVCVVGGKEQISASCEDLAVVDVLGLDRKQQRASL